MQCHLMFIKINGKYYYLAVNENNGYLLTKLTNARYGNVKIGYSCPYYSQSLDKILNLLERSTNHCTIIDKNYTNTEIDSITDSHGININDPKFDILYLLHDFTV